MPRPRTGTAVPHGDHFDIRITLPDGSRSKAMCLRGKTRAQARAEAKRLTEYAAKHGAVRADVVPKGPALTIGDIVDRWVPLIQGGDLAPATKGGHVQHARRIAARFGKVAPDRLTTGDLRTWFREMQATLSSSRVRHYAFTLSKMLDDAAAENWIDCPNPCRHPMVRKAVPSTQAPHDDEKAHHVEDEASRLVRATKAPERRVRYVLAFATGMRDGELAGLRWRDIGEEKGVDVFRIRGALAREGDTGWATRRDTKTPAGRRMIPIHPVAAHVLDAWRAHGWEAYVGRAPTDDDAVLPAANGTPFRPRSSLFLREDLKAAGLPTTFEDAPFEFRSTRRSFATWLEAHDVSGDAIDRLLGHAGVSVRRRHYSAANLETLARAVLTIRLDLGEDSPEASSESSGGVTKPPFGGSERADGGSETPAFDAESDEPARRMAFLKTGGGASLPSASAAESTGGRLGGPALDPSPTVGYGTGRRDLKRARTRKSSSLNSTLSRAVTQPERPLRRSIGRTHEVEWFEMDDELHLDAWPTR